MRDVLLLRNSPVEFRPGSAIPLNIEANARRLATILGGTLREAGEVSAPPFFTVPQAAVANDVASAMGLTGRGDLYGAVVTHPAHADKAILHELVSPEAPRPAWYDPEFADSVSGVTLRGFTAFTAEDVRTSVDLMRAAGVRVRLKDPSNTGGAGQAQVSTDDDVTAFLTAYGDRVSETGIVAECELADAITVSVGRVDLRGEVFTWFGRPFDVVHDGLTRFGGNTVTVVRGDFAQLVEHATEPGDLLAIEQSSHVLRAYETLGARIARAAIDVVQGAGPDGAFCSGVTDPSLRPSGSSAAELRAVEALIEHRDATVATSRVRFDYQGGTTPPSPAESVFIAHERVTIYVALVSVR